MITLNQVRKKFREQEVLKGISLQVKKGDVVAILGPSGSGKTTFLRCINFLERADGGTLMMNHDNKIINLATASPKEILSVRRKTAFVFQNYNLFKNKTSLENIMEGLVTARSVKYDEAKKKAEEALAWVGLSAKRDVYPCQLSGGQQQRIGIARAVVLDPEIILFDEPTSALDPELVGEVLEVLRKVARQGITMIVVTHEMNFAREVADRVVFMVDGQIIEDSSSESFFKNPKTERAQKFLARSM